ncbi:hypothetical protein [Stigmatella hybrida]|uniref:hypothetical protein n=1 Tax=Stigmatella hybrida TaxID=394097 RepID=UPI001CDB2F1D|nr:hypothetical protein [Stigmatella hybrida]
MKAAFYLFMIAGAFGGFDVLYYHIYTHRLYRQPSAIWENVTHFTRALLFAVFFTLIVHVKAAGAWWWLYPAIIAVEFVNTMLDTVLEPSSRKSLGGLPTGEYILHVFLSLITGAALACMLWDSHGLLSEPTSLTWHTLDLPASMVFGAYMSTAAAVGFFAFESYSFLKQLSQRLQKPAGDIAVKPA